MKRSNRIRLYPDAPDDTTDDDPLRCDQCGAIIRSECIQTQHGTSPSGSDYSVTGWTCPDSECDGGGEA